MPLDSVRGYKRSLGDVIHRCKPGTKICVAQAAGEPRRALKLLLEMAPPGLALLTGLSLSGAKWVEVALERGDLITAMHTSTHVPGHPRSRLWVLDWAYLPRLLRAWKPDVVVVAVSPPNRGSCRLSLSAGYIADIIADTPLVIGEINDEAPPLPDSPSVPVERFAALVEAIEPPPTLKAFPRTPSETSRLADFVSDGAVIQAGIGRRVEGALSSLSGHRRLRIASGLLSSALMQLIENGAVEDAGGAATVGEIIGGREVLTWLRESPLAARTVRLRGLTTTHDERRMSKYEKFTAINSAFQIDYSGQVNAEWRPGLDRRVGIPGGLPCFARGAFSSSRGRFILVLPTGKATIVDRLVTPAITLPSYLVDTVLVDDGKVLALRDCSIEDRHSLLAEARHSYSTAPQS